MKAKPKIITPDQAPHLHPDRLTQWASILRNSAEPTADRDEKKKIAVRAVYAVFLAQKADEKTEVLYRDSLGEPMTAFFVGRDLLYITEGW